MGISIVNRLTISGNERIKNFIHDLNEKFISDEDASTGVRRIVYGHSAEYANRISNELPSKRVFFINESNWRHKSQCISFTSNGSSIVELEIYLLIILSQLDPFVLLCNQFQDEYLNEVSTRYSLMSDLQPIQVETSTQIKKPKVETEAFFNKVTKLAEKDKEKAFKLVQKSCAWISNERFV
jgi:hypothetical protein